MKNQDKHSSLLGYVDTLMNILLGYVFLVIILILAMKVQDNKSETIQNKNEFVVVMNWGNGSNADIDLWIKDPVGIVGYKGRDNGLSLLQKDNTGVISSRITTDDGRIIDDARREEIINVKKIVTGDYTVNVYYYRPDDNNSSPVDVSVKLIKINPYSVVSERTIKLDQVGQEVTAFNFTVDSAGNVGNLNKVQNDFVNTTIVTR